MSGIEIKEVLPKMGQIHQTVYQDKHLDIKTKGEADDPRIDMTIGMILCKPKLLPMKSVTLEKLDRMQKEAQDIVKQQEKESQKQAQMFGGQYDY